MAITNAYTAGLSMPWKLVRHAGGIVDGCIRPEHIKLYPTNRCNARCTFCSVRDWAKDEEIPGSELLELVRHFHSLGTRAITLAGGGEPTLHPQFDELLDLCAELDIQTGVITNGLLWSDKRKTLSANGKLVWARMSVVDAESGRYDVERLRRFSQNLPDVAIGCYVTVTSGTDAGTMMKLADLADELPNVTHFKLGEESERGAPEKMDELEALLAHGHSKTFFHRHSDSVPGDKNCLVSLLRPVVAADGYVYPCCNMELSGLGHIKPTMFRMAYWRDFTLDTAPFDGNTCPKCAFSNYNHVLAAMTEPMEHERFL